MRLTLGHIMAISAVLAVALVAPAAKGAAPDPGKPLGTLWYPGPYRPPTPTLLTVPIVAPTPVPEIETPAIKPVATDRFPTPPASGPQPGKPLGTLWVPEAYGKKPSTPQTLPPSVIDPQPVPPLPRPPARKPLGTLWFPGPYDPNAPSKPVPVPSPATEPSFSTPFGPQHFAVEEKKEKQAPPPRESTGRIGRDLPVHLSADEMSFNEKRKIITATGNVEVIQRSRRLLADTITYNQITDVVSASGNVELTEPGGEIIFSDRMELSGDLRDAVIESIGMILTDRSRIAATGARRSAGSITEMRKGVYSPCNLCPDHPERPPLWQVKAVKIIHDKKNQIIEYRDAWLEVYGVPVGYLPYLSHPAPSVKRKTGFLIPTLGGSTDLGLVTRIPYYINISPQQDATITPLITENAGSGAIAEYRGRFLKGTIDATGSFVAGNTEGDSTAVDSNAFRGHILSEARFDINDTWRWGFNFNRATDDTYMRRYGLGGLSSLNSKLFIEGFRQRSYFAANGLVFQGLQSNDDPGLEPLVLPLIDYNYVGDPDRFGGQTTLDVNILSITRNEGSDTRRLSVRPHWNLPYLGPLGDSYNLSFMLYGDLYDIDELQRTGKANFSGVTGRVQPQVMLDWRYPFVKRTKESTHTLEPIAQAVYSPNSGNSDKIPNEDSQELEFDDTNLFSDNKFSGIDRIEEGTRLNYGFKWSIFLPGGTGTFFIGQSWRPENNDTFATGSGLEEDFSDLVGRTQIDLGSYLNFVYRTRFASDTFVPKKNELTFSAGVPAFRAQANYTFLETQENSEFPGREEINYGASSRLNRFWRVGLSGVNDLAAGETRRVGGNITYENECFVFKANLTRTLFEDRDLEPTNTITFNFLFKTLGPIRADVFKQ
jgi:LPS-assembly protein